jgi:beta-lactamase class A
MTKDSIKKLCSNRIVQLCITAGVSFLCAYFFFNREVLIKNTISRDLGKTFVLTSPILDCENIGEIESVSLSHTTVEKNITAIAKKYEVQDYSVYFRKLNEGQWIGINEKDFFTPASMMKTPLLIAFLKRVEQEPELLDTKVIATKDFFDRALKQSVVGAVVVEEGKTYTLKQIAEYTIQQSDNVATLMLFNHVRKSDLDELFEAIGVTQEEVNGDVNIRTKDFGAFFRVLYNASYLNKEMSEVALSMLANSNFMGGIRAGTPPEIVVAQKYGERNIEQQIQGVVVVEEKQFHDCGIVYAPGKPYIICIMTRGQNFDSQQKFITDTAKYIYQEVENSSNE